MYGEEPVHREQVLIKPGRNVELNREYRYLSMYPHSHAFFEIKCVLRGTCLHHLAKNEYPMQKGDITIIPPGIQHKLDINHDTIVINMMIRKSTILTVFSRILEKNTSLSEYLWKSMDDQVYLQPINFRCADDIFIEEQVLAIYGQQLEQKPYHHLIIESLTQGLLCYLMQNYSTNILFFDDNRIQEIKKYIAKNWQTVNLSKLSKAFHLSPSYLSRYIHERTGKTFSALLISARLQYAKLLLKDSHWNVDFICQKAGYGDVSYFIRQFKKAFGLTPKQYRLNH
jgi:AraC-like DNA-binding protein